MARPKGFCLGAPAPIASLRSLPRRRKQPFRLFSSATLPPCSNPLRTEKESTNHKGCHSLFLARPKGFEPPFFRIGICCVIQLRHGRKYIGRQKPSFFNYYFSYPLGLPLCQRQVSSHISLIPYCASQPSISFAFLASAYTSSGSPGRRGSIT